jgi:hypothetical protein
MDYRFKYEIIDENDEVKVSGSTYVIPDSISMFGECESVDMETCSGLRYFKKLIEKENEKGNDTEGED